ncbi:hypothetical protein ABT340_41340 [Streptosporangium sp. NPDC000239]|uniref:hypothetical protein n=1 Tax=Streptosporangium sp. NPDC000239 TaxID=3154248 RepID=UPI00332D5EFB
MSEDIPQSVEVVESTAEKPVERDDYNNGNLRTFEVTWENGTVEHVAAHWVFHPAPDFGLTRSKGEHIQFTGWYDGKHRTALSVRPDRVRSIRDLGVLPPSPDAGSPQASDFGVRIPIPPEPVRIDHVEADEVVTTPAWCEGRAVRLTSVLGDCEDGVPPDHVQVHWESLDGCRRGVIDVPQDFQVTPWSATPWGGA